LAIGSSALTDALYVFTGFSNISLSLFLVKSLLTNIKKTKLALIHFSGVLLYKAVFFVRFLASEHQFSSDSILFEVHNCDLMFPMIDIYSAKIIFSSVFDLIAIFCFFIMNTKLSKDRTQRKFLLNNNNNSKTNVNGKLVMSSKSDETDVFKENLFKNQDELFRFDHQKTKKKFDDLPTYQETTNDNIQ